MVPLVHGTFRRSRRIALVVITGVVCVFAAHGLIPTASAYPGAVDRDCPANGPCETVIQASDGNTYYADDLGGGHGYVVQVGADGQPAQTLEVTASQDQVAMAVAEHGRRLALWGKDMTNSGIFAAGSSTDVRVNTVNVNGSGYVEFAADPSRDLPAQVAIQVIGGDGQVYASARFDRDNPKLQSAFKDYMAGAAALNTAAARLRSLLASAGGITTVAAGTLIAGVASKAYSEANTLTGIAAVGSLAVAGLAQLYNAWRDVDTARNNLINLYNNLNASAGRDVLAIPLVAFGGITAQSVVQNQFHSFRLP
jgi:hypothetical protein